MSQQLSNNTPINESGDEDYIYQQWLESEKLNGYLLKIHG